MALALALAVAASSVVALAFWSAAGAGSASAASGTLDAAAITVPGTGINSVTVTWATQASLTPSADNGAVTYSVQRRLGTGSWAAVASGGCSGAKPRGTTSCVDAPAAAGGYGYRVLASYHTWTATSNEPAAVSFVLDSVAPTVQSIALLAAGTTNAATVHWTVTFSEPVSGVDAGDFALARSDGVTGGSISSVSGSATSYTVTSSTGSGDGMLGLNLVDDDTITDAGANKLGGSGTGNGNLTGAAYSLDRTAPTVTSIARVDSTPTNAATVHWTVTFSEPVAGVDSADFALASTGPTGAAISSVSGSATSYTVTSSTGSGDGTLGLNLVDDDTITDGVANKLGGTGAGNGNLTGAAYGIDRTAPALSSLVMLDTNANGKVDRVTATFSETLASSTSTAPWTLAAIPSSGTLASVSTSGTIATLTVAEGAGAADTALGSFTIALAVNASGIRDVTGNQASFAITAPTDAAAPARLSMSMLDSNTNGKIDRVTATFSEPLVGSTPAVGQWTLASTPSNATLASVSASGSTATLGLTEGTGTADTAVGSFTITLATNSSGIRDATGNQSSFAATAPTDAAAPVTTALQMLDANANGKVDQATATFSEALANSTGCGSSGGTRERACSGLIG